MGAIACKQSHDTIAWHTRMAQTTIVAVLVMPGYINEA